MIQNRPVRLLLLALLLVIPALSSRALANQVSDDELRALHLAFRGFAAVTLPGGPNGCEGREASEFVRRRHEFYLAWFSVTLEAVCVGRPVQTAEVWFQCSDRNSITCSPSQPAEAASTGPALK